jgi:Family of unknown function (DUF6461)
VQELAQFSRLRPEEPLRSPSGRYLMHYDNEGVAVITDTASGEVTWRAGEEGRPAAGLLLLGCGDAVQVETPKEHQAIWRSAIAASGARELTLTDEGDLELLNDEGTLVFNSRTGPVEPRAIPDCAPAADITVSRFLLRQGRKLRRTVARKRDGALRVGEHDASGGHSYELSGPLVRWLEQDGTLLTWRLLPASGTHGPKWWTLCLVDRDDVVLWREYMRNLAVGLPAAKPHAYGGPELGSGGRLRHQSLTSASGAHTLVHQEDGNLVLHCNAANHAVWATGTWWAGDGWAELTADGELVVRNLCGAQAWSSGTADSGGRRLVVRDDGRVALLDADDAEVWSVDAHTACTEPGTNVARGPVMRRGQVLRSQSLTSDDGSTVLTQCRDRRIVLYGEDGHWIWNDYVLDAERSALALDEDGILRVRGEDNGVILELGGPGDELRVLAGEVRLSRDDGTVVWRQGGQVTGPGVDAESAGDFSAWMGVLAGDGGYCTAVVHDVTPDEALRRLGAAPERITSGTWDELPAEAHLEEAGLDDLVVAAFALGPHTLLVGDDNWTGANTPELSRGTFAVLSRRSMTANRCFLVFRDGGLVGDHSGNGAAEATTPEVSAAIEAMAADDVLDAVFEEDLELLCRTAGVRPTVADVTGVARWAFIGSAG